VRQIAGLIVLVAVFCAVLVAQEPTVVFKSGIEQVAIAAVVRDSKGKLVTTLKPSDFELYDSGVRRKLTNVWSEASPASVAILMDASGSMATKMERARDTASLVIAGLKPGADELALYSFDTSLQEVRPFSTTFSAREGAWNSTKAFGATSLWDAIAATAQKIADRQRRRAVVVITDGVDSASTLKPADVSAIASELDVPVYMIVISLAMEDPGPEVQPVQGPLADLAAWTGGDSYIVRNLVTSLSAAQQILAELHHQYVLAFEPGSAAGWHPLIVRTRKSGLFVRARSGYMVK
jgi:Ca-activated chloride channel family protein